MTNESYQDRWTRYHHKPTIDGSVRSNNGWIYSAYGKYLAKDTIDLDKLVQCYNGCTRSYFPLKIDRSPNDPTPPNSKDEVVGMVSFGFLNYKELEASHYNFCNLEYAPKKLTIKSIYESAKALYKIRKEHRNYVWQNKVTQGYALAFYLAPHDQYYVRRYFDQKTTLLQKAAFYLNFASTVLKGNKSVRMMLWLQCEDMKHPLLKYIPKEKYVRAYFNEDHPFVKGLG